MRVKQRIKNFSLNVFCHLHSYIIKSHVFAMYYLVAVNNNACPVVTDVMYHYTYVPLPLSIFSGRKVPFSLYRDYGRSKPIVYHSN